jgi:hypothetical protein
MTERRRRWISALRKAGLIAVVNMVMFVLLFVMLEGASSLLFVTHEIMSTPTVPERSHVEHDRLLGWVNLPNVHLADFYGEGRDVRTNGQRFRNSEDFTRSVPPGRVRIVCSGDSFTFGYGVDDEQAWCQHLVALDPRLQTVNMGLGGYGVDQAYLWYMRDGLQFEHQLHLFVFLTDDFRRMRSDRFMGYGKPLLTVQGDSIAVANLPVPETSWFIRRRALHGETIARLSIVRLSRKLLGLDDAAAAAERTGAQDAAVRDVVARIFEDLRRANEAKNSRIVLVYLPGAWDYKPDPQTDDWRRYVREEAARQGILLLDLVEEIRGVRPTQVDDLYAPNRHFSAAGNFWAAEVLYRELKPLLAPHLSTAQTSARAPAQP